LSFSKTTDAGGRQQSTLNTKDTKMKKKYLTIISIILVSLILYFNTPFHIKQHSWKNSGGGRISDFIQFDDANYCALKWPFIYKDQEKAGCMIFCLYDRLWIYSYRTGSDHGMSEYVAK
jgi:hypothetical protein